MELELEKEKLLEYLKKDLLEKMEEKEDKKATGIGLYLCRNYVIN